jgi:hypothetical protein
MHGSSSSDYTPHYRSNSVVGEFSFDYDVLDSEADEDELEMYPHRVVEGANRLFSALQKQEGWISFNTTTKTAFALEVL